MAVSRNTGSNWVLPTVNEWYKSAFYSGGGVSSAYWTYATQSNTTPSNVLSATGTNNANFTADIAAPPFSSLTDPVNYLTPVGAFADSPSAYRTFDQNGDAWQWNETTYGGTARGFAGGSYASGAGFLISQSIAGGAGPTAFNDSIGFRVAYVPEPTTISLLVTVAIFVIVIRHRFLNQANKG